MLKPSPHSRRLVADERNSVEVPFLEGLKNAGWAVIDLSLAAPASASRRADFEEVVIAAEFVNAMRRINAFLQEDQIDDLYRKLCTLPSASLVEMNRKMHEFLLNGDVVDENRQTGLASPSIKFIDFDNLKNNRFLAIAQYKVRIPGTDKFIVPDITLFVNGIPLVVIECKSPLSSEPIAEGIEQLLRYTEQRGYLGEGVPAMFAYNAFVVATARTVAKFGTVSTNLEKHFFRWLDPYPLDVNDLEHGSSAPNDQVRLVAGMLSHENLLSLVRDYTVFPTDERGQTVKVVARYQQFRAVKKAIRRLQTGTTKAERSGIIWHTQGSGKSLTMLWMVREMHRRTEFSDWKIVFLTDRTDLQEQLEGTALSIGQSVKIADSIQKAKELIASPAADVVMVMSQKFQERNLDSFFPRLNESDKILIMVDEAHRTQYSTLALCMNQAMPNAAQIAYTGTPIDKTERTFGDYIDKYTMRQSVEEGTTLRIVYEGRTHNAEVSEKAAADAKFADVFSDYNLNERLQILGYNTREAYLDSLPEIEAKSRDMVEHYVEGVFPNGFKGQVVANSREAAVRYKVALEAAIAKKVAALEADNPRNIDLDQLRLLDVEVVISASDRNDAPHLKTFGDKDEHRRSIARFKMKFGETVEEDNVDGHERLTGNVGLIVVNNMLLTGFDAPVEQVLYLDRVLREHGLLQAIARVNRIGGEGKDEGFVVDYVGVGHHLKRALENYEDAEQEEILKELHDAASELAELQNAHAEVWKILQVNGISDFSDLDAFSDLFYDEEIRNRYILAFRALTKAFNNVLPRNEAMPYWNDYQNFVRVNELASRHLRDHRLSMRGIPPKLRALADEFLKSHGVTVKIKPLNILSDDFDREIQSHGRSKTKAAAIEHAVRNYLEVNWDEDPELFATFSASLDQILADNAHNWQVIEKELEELRTKIKDREKEETWGLDRKREMPIHRIFCRELYPDVEVDDETNARLVELTQNVVDTLARETRLIGFWNSIPAQNKLKREIEELMVAEETYKFFGAMMFNQRSALTSRFLEWALGNKTLLARRF